MPCFNCTFSNNHATLGKIIKSECFYPYTTKQVFEEKVANVEREKFHNQNFECDKYKKVK